MSEKIELTVGEMLDSMKPGDKVIGTKGFYGGTVLKMTDYGEVVFNDGGGFFKFTSHARHSKWKLYKTYVPFEEAYQAFNDGKWIYSHEPGSDEKHYGEYHRTRISTETIEIKEMLYYNWTIEE